MALSRRALGIGLIAASAAATGGYLLVSGNPRVGGYAGRSTKLSGFVGGEKESFVGNPRVRDLLLRQFGLALDARRAGSVEMVREADLLGQRPDFLWPSSSVMVEIARRGGVHVLRDQVILNTPIVLFSWDRIADQLVRSGYARAEGGPRYTIDLTRLLKAVIAGQDWSALGVADLYGHVRILSTDPNRSNSGFMFAGLAASLLAGDVVTIGVLDKITDGVVTIFQRMGFKPSSSGKMFDDYIAGGAAAQPLVVGYENQLVEWVAADPDRWKRVSADAPSKPVVLYPQPTVFSAHPLLALTPPAEQLIPALLSPELLDLAWQDHGFRGPLGTVGKSRNPLVQTYLLDEVSSILPMPDAETMLALLGRLAR
jgi:hypothetical protein